MQKQRAGLLAVGKWARESASAAGIRSCDRCGFLVAGEPEHLVGEGPIATLCNDGLRCDGRLLAKLRRTNHVPMPRTD